MAERRAVLAAALARHFFGADPTLQEYAEQSVLTALDDGDDIEDLAGGLESFLRPGLDKGALTLGLEQLWQALGRPHDQPSELHRWAWAQAAAEDAAPGGCDTPALPSAAGSVGQDLTTLAPVSPLLGGAAAEPAQPGKAPVELSAARAVSRGLSVSATEFRPSYVPRSPRSTQEVTSALASLAVADGSASGRDSLGDGTAAETRSCQESNAAEWEGGAGSSGEPWPEPTGWQHAGDDPRCAEFGAGSSSGGASWQGRDHATAPPWGAGSGSRGGGEVLVDPHSQAAFLEVLAQQFPFYSAEALCQLFEQQGCSPAAMVDVLCSMEAEVQGQAAARQWDDPVHQQGRGAPEPSFGEDEFPSLSAVAPRSGSGGHGHGISSVGRGTLQPQAGYADVAAAAAGLPAQSAAPRRAGAMAGTPPGASAPAAAGAAAAGRGAKVAAPIWEARGVQQFGTGSAVAEQYAAQRESARDHARLRNQYFQQATQAFLAGHKALAKELGATGRWHGEQMQLAHDAAAARLFAQRNAAALQGSGAGSGSGGVPTVDLHGLHVAEALDIIDWMVAEQRRRRSRRLRVVVGVGQHGHSGGRLPAAVRRHLEQQGLPFSETYEGLLEVVLH